MKKDPKNPTIYALSERISVLEATFNERIARVETDVNWLKRTSAMNTSLLVGTLIGILTIAAKLVVG